MTSSPQLIIPFLRFLALSSQLLHFLLQSGLLHRIEAISFLQYPIVVSIVLTVIIIVIVIVYLFWTH